MSAQPARRAAIALSVISALGALGVSLSGCAADGETARRSRMERPWRSWRGWPARPAHDATVQCPPVNNPSEILTAYAGASVIRRNSRWFRRCYSSAAEMRPMLMGTLNVRFTVRCDGTVSNAVRMEGMDEAPEVRACVKDLLKSLEFPRPRGGEATFSYPFSFLPERPPDQVE